jgi:hypothetical protein
MTQAVVDHTYAVSELIEYRDFLVKEIRRIKRGGAHAPWLTAEQDLTRLRGELAWARSILRRSKG